MNIRKNISIFSLILASVALPLSFFSALLAEMVFKQRNANNIDITADLAYLSNILWIGFGVYILIISLALIAALVGLKSEHPRIARYSIVVILIILTLSGLGFVVQKQTNKIEKDYSQKQFNTLFLNLQNKFKTEKK